MFLHLLFGNILFHLSSFILSSFAIISVFIFFIFLLSQRDLKLLWSLTKGQMEGNPEGIGIF